MSRTVEFTVNTLQMLSDVLEGGDLWSQGHWKSLFEGTRVEETSTYDTQKILIKKTTWWKIK